MATIHSVSSLLLEKSFNDATCKNALFGLMANDVSILDAFMTREMITI